MEVVKVNYYYGHVTLPMWDEGCSWLCDVVVKVLCLYPKGLLGSNPGRGDSCTAFQWMVC